MWRPDAGAPRRWLRLPAAERRVVAEAVVALAAASIVTALASPARLSGWLAATRRPRRPDARVPVARLAALTAATAGRVPFGAGCLPQSLALAWMLARRGHDATLVVGVGRPGGRFAAHAWVEHGGAVLLAPDTARLYAPLWRRSA